MNLMTSIARSAGLACARFTARFQHTSKDQDSIQQTSDEDLEMSLPPHFAEFVQQEMEKFWIKTVKELSTEVIHRG